MTPAPDYKCRVCHDYGWRWTSRIKGGDCGGQWSGWYARADQKHDPAIPEFAGYNLKRECICGQPVKAAVPMPVAAE